MKNISRIITVALGIILCASLFAPLHGNTTADACEEAPQSFDLSVIENWCGSGTERGSIRFVGAEVYAREGNTLTLIDEQGNLWDVEALNIDDNDFLLLWINDNDTDDVEDDTIIKVWREAY